MRFMSVGSNCADLSYLGDNRVKGPVDNWIAQHGLSDVIHLFTDFERQIRVGFKATEHRTKSFKSDSDTLYIYDSYACPHLNMTIPKKVNEVIARISDFHKFLNMVKTKNDCYFSYNLCKSDVIEKDGKYILKKQSVEALGEIENFVPLKKFIFVGLRDSIWGDYFNAHIDVVPSGINYFDLYGISRPNTKDTEKNQKDFYEYMKTFAGGTFMTEDVELYTMRRTDGRKGLKKLIETVKDKIGCELKMVEIGSYAGESSEIWAQSGVFKKVICVDCWKNGWDEKAHASKTTELAEKRFDEISSKYKCIEKIKSDSLSAAEKFENDSLDIVYIDATHTYESVKSDIEAWLPKVRKGGIIAGHDYSEHWEGVMRAVDEKFGKPDMTFIDTSWLVFVKND